MDISVKLKNYIDFFFSFIPILDLHLHLLVLNISTIAFFFLLSWCVLAGIDSERDAFNSLKPESDQHQISYCNITAF